jgi:hypothetical protein
VEGKKPKRCPRAKTNRKAGQEDELAEINGIAREAIRTFSDDPFRQRIYARTSTSQPKAELSYPPVLQVTPGEQQQSPGVEGRRHSVYRKFN